MSDRLHEIMGEIAVLHKELISTQKIRNAKEVLEYISSYKADTQKHYKNLLLQYYFQENDLENLKTLLLAQAKFDIRFSDIKESFCNIKDNNPNVIEFMEDSIVYLKDDSIKESLLDIYNYYNSNEKLRVYLEEALEILKRNRYICAFCFKSDNEDLKSFFINEDLLASLRRDLPHLLK
jgi:hypothetical protein